MAYFKRVEARKGNPALLTRTILSLGLWKKRSSTLKEEAKVQPDIV
jgi:hypothetical protein